MAIDLNDKSQNSNTLTNEGADEISTSLPFAQSDTAVECLLANTDYLNATDSASLDVVDDITMEAWIKINQLPSASSTMAIAGKHNPGSDQEGYTFFISAVDDRVSFQYSDDGDSTGRQAAEIDTALDGGDVGVWIHFAVSVDVSSQTFVFYRDGSSVANTTYTNNSSASIFNNNADFAIGARESVTTWGLFFDGKIDDVRLWNDIRTPTEISDNYNIELVGNEAGLVAYYPFETALGAAVGIASQRLKIGHGA